MKKISAFILVSILFPFTSPVFAGAFKMLNYAGKYDGVDAGGNKCTILIEKWSPWMKAHVEQYKVTFISDVKTSETNDDKVKYSIVIPNKLDHFGGTNYYYQSHVDSYDLFFNLNLIYNNHKYHISGVSLRTVDTGGADQVCYKLKLQE